VADRVVLLHGQPGSGREWCRVIDALGDSVDAVAPDRPGYGDNPLPAGGVAENVDWLERQLEADGERAAPLIVAHSWAGSMVLGLARRRPDLVRGLVLVGSVGPGAITRMDRVMGHPAVGSLADRWEARVTRPVRRTPAALLAFLAEQRSLVRDLPAVVDGLDGITAPAIVLAGTRDHIVQPSIAEALAARLPNAELVSVPGGGHRLHRTHPQLVARVVRRGLAKSPRT
jgi:pimeloyl-ACP methyl ester carboxylesterase